MHTPRFSYANLSQQQGERGEGHSTINVHRSEQRLGELERDVLAREVLVNRGERVQLVLDVRQLRLVQMHLNEIIIVNEASSRILFSAI